MMKPCETYSVKGTGYEINTERSQLDIGLIHGYLERSYWSPGVPRRVVEKAIEHSLCFGLYKVGDGSDRQQIGFARVVTDFARFAYIADVFVLSTYQGQGLGTWLMHVVTDCPLLDDVSWMFLATRDAHGLYEKVGFKTPLRSDMLMSKSEIKAWFDPEMAETHES